MRLRIASLGSITRNRIRRLPIDGRGDFALNNPDREYELRSQDGRSIVPSSNTHPIAPRTGGATPDEGEEAGGRAFQRTLSTLLQAKWTIILVFVGLSAVGLPLIWTMVKANISRHGTRAG